MRTTLTLDPDVAAKARMGAAQLGKPCKEVVTAALRTGLDHVLKPPGLSIILVDANVLLYA
jgi:hypothetical protein